MHFTYYCILDKLPELAYMEEEKYSLLKAFCAESLIMYYDPSSMWRMTCDFDKMVKNMKNNDDYFMHEKDLKMKYFRLKLQKLWLIIQVIKPAFHVYKAIESTPLAKIHEDDFDDERFS